MSHISRNAPCPCGSGKKYKQCCAHLEDGRPGAIRPTEEAISYASQTAFAHYEAGQLAQAEAIYRRILQVAPKHPEALHLLGLIAHQTGRLELAAELIGKSIAVAPAIAEAHYNLGMVLQIQGKLAEAAASYQKALSLKPDYYVEARYNLGVLFQAQGKLAEAAVNYQQAIAIDPDDVASHNNLGKVLHDQGKLAEAVASYQKALSLKPDSAETHLNLGSALENLRQLDAALACYDKAIELQPDLAEAYLNKSLALLSGGDLDQGWELHEWRWRVNNAHAAKPRPFKQPLWLGKESLRGKTILLHSEQGLGDTIQFVRYASLLAGLGARVILEAQASLVELLQAVDGVAEIVSAGSALPAFDFHCPLMSLPLAFKTAVDTIPARIPYLFSNTRKRSEWRERLGEKTGLRIGLVWSGGFRPDQPELWGLNERRNIPLSKLAALNIENCAFYSLQKGDDAIRQLSELEASSWSGPKILDYTREFNDFSDTAAFIDNLDLVISVDTSTAHLAGAMGKEVWLLNRFDTCWRWLLDRSDSPWYPTLTLFRQPSLGDWDSVVALVREGLLKRTAANSPALPQPLP